MKKDFKFPLFIAEISANHCGKLSIAKKLIKCAKFYGADAVKLQTYTADSMTINSDKKYFKIKEGLWKGYKLWDLYNDASTPLIWHSELFNYAKKLKIKIFSSPFDSKAVDLLEDLNAPIYKVASFEMLDFPLIKRISKTKKPVIISTGMASMSEIEMTYNYAKNCGIKDLALLYCVSNYPAKKTDFNINNIKILKEKFNCVVGISDHSKDENVVRAAISAGAEIVEKHIALENQNKGLDIAFSLKGKEIRHLKKIIDETSSLLGKKTFHRNKSENQMKLMRRSIFAVKDIKKGDRFTNKNIRCIRPGYGLDPPYYSKILLTKSNKNIKSGEPIKLNMLQNSKFKNV